jgi:hypothetical protein
VDIAEEQRITVVGVLRVSDHGPGVVNGVFVPGWAEARVAG